MTTTVQIRDMTFDKVEIGPVDVRVFQGADYEKAPPVLIYFHSGAFLDEDRMDSDVATVLAQTGAIVVIPDFNAPLGGVFPKPLEVGFSIFSYLAKKRAGLGDRKSLLLVAGAESGGNLAAAIALKARDYRADELDGQILLSPLLDPFMGSNSIRKAATVGMRERWSDGWSHYLSGGVCHPYAAPCTCSRLAGIAPALVVSSQDDPLRDETLSYAQKLRDSGVDVQEHIFPADASWPSIYGASCPMAANWESGLGDQFARFVRSLAIQ
ncbi:acetyl esterase/lipase [Breoghania corrubedonensis]|uniref:Acetyl esterase/lipase n=1 Tax=Breoghania corrubedonensis TaxID=665038 RepID=A0A2T5V6C8_9HYPH|nr:alpha/beta hydrolase [Breoghania corrubedonensis]PTW59308.1 acetyl esterase/lipase [Breoghania corrubedonensis]